MVHRYSRIVSTDGVLHFSRTAPSVRSRYNDIIEIRHELLSDQSVRDIDDWVDEHARKLVAWKHIAPLFAAAARREKKCTVGRLSADILTIVEKHLRRDVTIRHVEREWINNDPDEPHPNFVLNHIVHSVMGSGALSLFFQWRRVVRVPAYRNPDTFALMERHSAMAHFIPYGYFLKMAEDESMERRPWKAMGLELQDMEPGSGDEDVSDDDDDTEEESEDEENLDGEDTEFQSGPERN